MPLQKEEREKKAARKREKCCKEFSQCLFHIQNCLYHTLHFHTILQTRREKRKEEQLYILQFPTFSAEYTYTITCITLSHHSSYTTTEEKRNRKGNKRTSLYIIHLAYHCFTHRLYIILQGLTTQKREERTGVFKFILCLFTINCIIFPRLRTILQPPRHLYVSPCITQHLVRF